MEGFIEQRAGLNPGAWVTNYGDLLYAYTYRRIQNREQAEDIVQDVFLSAWKSRDSFDQSIAEKSWLFVICQRKIIDFFRRRSNRATVALEIDESDTALFFDDGHLRPAYRPSRSWDIDMDVVVQKEFFSVLRDCASKLRQMQEQVFSLKYLNDLESDEICSLLDITDSNYWVLMHRAKIQIRTCMERNWVK